MKQILIILLLSMLAAACGGVVSNEEFVAAQATQKAVNEQVLTAIASLQQEATPAMPTPDDAPAAPAFQPPTPDPTDCRVIHDYQLRGLTEVATSSGNWLHVEYWVGGDAPEYETILPGGRYLLQTQFAGGHVWEYSGDCTFEQVKDQVQDHINRRLAQKANNGGYIEWQATGFFNPVR